MADTGSTVTSGGPPKIPVLKQIFDIYAEETITDEQIQRILEPILRMIRAGVFDKPRVRRYDWFFAPLLSVTAIAVLIVVVALTQKA